MLQYNDIDQIVSTTHATMHKLMEYKNGPDAIALYFRYIEQRKMQENNITFSMNTFMIKAFGWGEKRFRNAKKILIDSGMIENVIKRDEKGRSIGTFTKVNYIISTDLPLNGNAVERHCRKGGTNTLIVKENTLIVKEKGLYTKENSSKEDDDKSSENFSDSFDSLNEDTDDLDDDFIEQVVAANKDTKDGSPKVRSEKIEKSAQVTAILNHIKNECKLNGVQFGPNPKERNHVHWLMSKKFQTEALDETKRDLLKFISDIIETAKKISFYKVINSPASIYYNWSEVVNKARMLRDAKKRNEPKQPITGDEYNEKIRQAAERVEQVYQEHMRKKREAEQNS